MKKVLLLSIAILALSSCNANATKRFHLTSKDEYTYLLSYEKEGYYKDVIIEDKNFGYNSYQLLLAESEKNGEIRPACECYSLNILRFNIVKNDTIMFLIEFFDNNGRDEREIFFFDEDRSSQLHNMIASDDQTYLSLLQYYLDNVKTE